MALEGVPAREVLALEQGLPHRASDRAAQVRGDRLDLVRRGAADRVDQRRGETRELLAPGRRELRGARAEREHGGALLEAQRDRGRGRLHGSVSAAAAGSARRFASTYTTTVPAAWSPMRWKRCEHSIEVSANR